MTLFDLILGENGPTWLLGAIAVAALLTLIAAGLEIVVERSGGPDPTASPDWFATRGPALFVLGGVPALVIAVAGSVLLTLLLGNNPESSGLPFLIPTALNGVVVVAILCCGLGSPMTQHWGLCVAVFGVGVSAIFPLLYLTNLLPFAADGSLPYPDRIVFAIGVSLMLLSQIGAVAALIALAVTSIRSVRSLRDRRSERRTARLTLIRRRD
jgi:hypothetical protein